MAKTVKLSDIAKQLNTSTVTVSKALSGQKGVSDELRHKIKTLAQEMGYESLSVRKNLNEKKSYNIGVIISDRFVDQFESFYWAMYQEIAKEAVSVDCFSLLEIVPEEDEENAVIPKLVKEKKIDGLLVIGVMKDQYLKMLAEKVNIPIVFIDFYDRKNKGDYIVTDNYYGTYMLTNYLLDMGHTDIAYVGTLLFTSSITDRYFGFERAMMERGIDVKKDHILDDRDINSGIKDDSFEFKYPEKMPTAFVCNCDLAADAIIMDLEKKGYRVPEDVSVVGFDNYIVNQKSKVNLTTYEVNIKHMAHLSINILSKKIASIPYRGGYMVVPGKMVIKDSVSRII